MTDEVKFFHGTKRGFRPGGYLFPRAMHRGPGTTAPSVGTLPGAENYVHFTTEWLLAWAYAYDAPGNGAVKVVEVVPIGEVEHDPEHSIEMNAYRAGSARVVKVHKIPPITEKQAKDGWKWIY